MTTLLPSPTPMENGTEVATDTFGRLAPVLERIPRIGRSETPDDWLPWVLVARGLEDIVPYVRDMPKALREGPAWLRIRGTEPAIEIGIGWIDSEGVVAPADGRHPYFKFQVGFEEPPADDQQPRQLFGIVNLSKSSWDECFRLYSAGRDYRPVRMDRHRADTGGTYDAYSGEQLWEGGPLISFGWAATLETDVGVSIDGSTEIETSSTSSYFNEGLRYDHDRAGGRTLPIATGDVEIETTSDLIERRDTWPSVWPRGSWRGTGDTTSIPTPLEIS